MTDFDQGAYWRERVSGKMGLGAVGHRSLGAAYNRWIYRRRADILDALPKTIVVNSNTRVLDLGCGSGFYESYWKSRGVTRLIGIDISTHNVEILQRLFPEYQFIASDITQDTGLLDDQQDVVTLFDVLYHIVDDAAADRALAFSSAYLAEDGRLLIYDQLVKQDYSLRKHVKFRGRNHFIVMLHSHGLEIEQEIPLFVLLSPPIYGSRPLDFLITGFYAAVGLLFRAIPPIGSFAGQVAYVIDAWLMKHSILTPNGSLYVVRRSSKK